MSLLDFVTVTITAQTRTPTQVGFGTPLVAGYFTAWPDRIRTYQNLTDLAADGITSTGVGAATYWNVAAIMAQTPRPPQVKVARRTNAWTLVVDLVVTDATAGKVYKGSIGPLGGTAQSFQRTVPGSSTIAAEATAIKALIDAFSLAGSTALATTNVTNDTIRFTATMPGTMFVFSGRNPELQIFNRTAAPAAIAADLDAVRAADDDWYGLTLDSSSKAEVLVAAAWAETQLKILFADSADTENGTVGASSTLLKQLKAATYTRTSTWEDTAVLPAFLNSAIEGRQFAINPPGTSTYNGKTVAGVTVDAPSSTFENEVVTQNGNVYTTILGENVTRPGKMASGDFIDLIVGKDWLTARLKEAVFAVITGNERLPYTNGGVATLRGAVMGVLKRAQGTKENPGFLDPEVDPVVTAPRVEDVDPADRAARRYPNLSFSAKISGAIQSVNLVGTISV
jgi:Protein of unknown function (DUF3383)